jgi:3-oxoacyl-[acyl-carrier protein] reductase
MALMNLGDYRLDGKVALVTGASSGIGAATARELAAMGAVVAIGYHGNQTGAESCAADIRQAGGQGLIVRADVRRRDDVGAMVKRVVAELGPIEILVNNAGSLVVREPLAGATEAAWDEIYALNVRSVMLVTQAVVPWMREQGRGAIVNVGSVAGHHGGGPGAGAYGAAKGAVMTYTKSLARELAPAGIRVNGVAPGVIDTPFHERFTTAEMLAAMTATIPLGRIGTARECATVIAFLVSNAASFIVGETIEINGGQLMV